MGAIIFFIAIFLDLITQGKTGFFTFLYVITLIILWIIDTIKNKIEEKIGQDYLEAERIKRQNDYLTQVEPKYRHIHDYPPDWLERKYYFNKKYNRTCQKCGKSWGTMHTHHIIPLTRGGDNSPENLTLLCEDCHEEQHLHMLKRRLVINEKKYYRARKLYRKEQRLLEVNKIRKKLNLPELVYSTKHS